MMLRTSEENKARRNAEIKAGKKIGHTQKIEGRTMDDTCFCSCGWKSGSYWDGKEYAYADWVAHIKDQGASILYSDERYQAA